MKLAKAALAGLFIALAAPAAAEQPGPLPTPLPAPAQSTEQLFEPETGPILEEERRYMDADEFRARFENHTVHLTLGGAHYGSEYYMPGDRTIWIAGRGRCEDGVWDYSQRLFCFRYPGHVESCWTVFEARGSFWAESVDGLLLRIVAVEKRPLSCQPELFS